MIVLQSERTTGIDLTPLGASVLRDLEVGRYDHVPQRAPWLEAIVAEAARIAAVPAAVVNLMKSTTQRTVVAVGAEPTVHDRRNSMCTAIIDDGRTVHVADASVDERWVDNPFVDGRWGNIRFYGAHPLLTGAGFAVGTLCVLDTQPRELSARQAAMLDDLASQVVEELEASRLASLKAGMSQWGRAVVRSHGRT